jgi:quinol monooxygenase YgiN
MRHGYARIVLFTLGAGQRETAKQIADELLPDIKAHDGCQAAMSVIDDEAGEYGLLVLWKTKDDAEAASKVIGPRLSAALQDVAKGPATMRLMEVYEPSA